MNVPPPNASPSEAIPTAEAKERFAELLRRAEAGERFVVTRHGKPVAEIGPNHKDEPRKKLHGALAGKIWMADDCDELGPEWDEYTQ